MMQVKNGSPSRQDIGHWPCLAPGRNRSKATVRVGVWPPESGASVVAKDIGSQPLWFRMAYGRSVLRREWRAMAALAALPEVPSALYHVDADCIVMECRPGKPAHELPGDGELDQLIVQLEALVGRIHRMGITHGDLHRDNILRADDGSLSLIDWATSCVYGEQPSLWKRWACREFAALDRRAVAKIKARHAPHLLTDAERAILIRGGSRMYRLVKRFRAAIRRSLGRGKREGIDYGNLVAQPPTAQPLQKKEPSISLK